MSALVVSFDPGAEGRERIQQALEGRTQPVFLPDLDPAARGQALSDARVLLSRNTSKELDADETAALSHLHLVQFMSAGLDFIRLDMLPPQVPIACNAGAYAEPMAEHALAMILAAVKRLLPEHANLARGEFNQFTRNPMLRDMTVGILGFGGIGVAVARLLQPLGVRVHAVNRRGHSDEPVAWIGSVEQLDDLLAASDALVLSLPLTADSRGLLDARALSRMKPGAILVNLARGEIVDEDALYAHLLANPGFTACIDAWWVEPVRHGSFRMDRPFLDLPNVIGSPHNSASAIGWDLIALDRAVANCRRVLEGDSPRHLIDDSDRATAGT